MSKAEESPSGRARRQKPGKSASFLALQKLKQLKGSKNKYEIDELENVYDEVDEQEYSRTVINRQNDDWIVDDGGNGYIEDGREVFDDDLDDSSIQNAMKHSNAGPRKKKKVTTKSKRSIQDMIMQMPSNKKSKDTFDDDILGDLMNELKKEDTKKVPDIKNNKNKFCKTYHLNNKSNQGVDTKKTVTTGDNDMLLSIDKSNSSDDELMFDTLNENDSTKKSTSIKTSNNGACVQSTSQEITNDVSDESQSVNIEKCSDTNEVTGTQIIEDPGSLDISAYVGDQSNDTRIEEIFSILQNVSKNVRENTVPLSSLIVTKQLSKNPHEYPDRKQAHVSVALRLNKEGGRMWKVGDTISYIICEDGTDKSATERAYHIDEFKKKDNLKIDINYYLMSQILPVVLRICEPIEGIDDVLLARNLGLENIYKSKATISEQDNINAPISINEDKFKFCLPFKFNCRNEKCGVEITINSVTFAFPEGSRLSLSKCSNPECTMPPWKYLKAIQNALQLALRSFIDTYYESWVECENPLCSYKTRKIPLSFNGKYPKCPKCIDAFMHKVYSDMQLYNQIFYYHYIFDINQPQYKSILNSYSREIISAYDTLRETTDKFLHSSAYSSIDLSAIFTCKNSNHPKLSNQYKVKDDNLFEDICNSDNPFMDESDDEFILNLNNETLSTSTYN
ncbi:hypothetical protein M0802_003708 [Mischocyttarus mexicanus]|nr:hypothetical protein M0802_003708 [Mischocyttarus mexicanus]